MSAGTLPTTGARAEPARRATRREWIGLGVIALPCLLYSMDLTVLNLAVPALSADLRPSSTQLLWIVDVYGFMVAGSLVAMGHSAIGSGGDACCCAERLRSVPRLWWRPSRPVPPC
jgi:hypothetical protein